MEKEEIDELITRWVHPTDEHQRKHIDIYTEKAEGYFVDLAKTVITLSTGMIAFWGVINTAKIISVDTKYLVILFVVYFVSILLAIATILSLDLHYKHYADTLANEHRRLLKHYTGADWDALKEWRKNGFSEYVGKNGRGWQGVTVGLGVGALISFLLSLVLTIWPLIMAVMIAPR